MKRAYLGLSFLLFAVSVGAAAPSVPPLRVSGVYSDLAYNEEGGDLLGIEILIVPSGGSGALHWNAFVQIAEGEAPFCALLPITISGDKVEFTMPASGNFGGMRFLGTLSSTELTLHTPSGDIEHLRRGKSYWQ